MRIRHSIQSAGLIALALVGTAMAAPISMSLVGLDKAVAVDSRAQAILGGGSFNSRVGNPTLNDSLTTLFWCVDEENVINPGDNSAKYNANIILVTDTAAQAASVRKGDGTSWEDTFTFTAQQRYNGAAYLVEKIIAGGSGFGNDELQRAIWHLTDLAVGAETDNSAVWANSAYVAAKTFINANGITNNTWATVSGVASIGGALSTNTRQTFLVQVAAVPEPATYALMGGGLLLLAAIRRRRTN